MKNFILLLLFLSVFAAQSDAATRRYRLMFNTNPSTEVTIGWEQQSGTNPAVYYGTTDQGSNYAAYSNNQSPYRQISYFGMNNRFAKLTGLTPNTIYYFVIKDSEGTSTRYWFKTCPNVSTETISLIAGGDSRSGTTQRINSNKMVAKIRPHAVIFGGDLVDSPDNASIQEWLDNWQQSFTSDGQIIPLVHSFGNHEQYGSGGANFMYDLFDTSYDVYYNVRFGGNLFSMYNLNGEVLPGHTIANSTVRNAQKTWLQNTLATDNSIWKAAQYHRPMAPHESGKSDGADEYNDWVNTFYNNKVRLVIESDAHVVKLTQEVKPTMTTASGSVNSWFSTTGIEQGKGITFIGEGCWGTIRDMDDSKPWTQAGGSFYQFSWLLIDACKIEIRTIDTQSPNTIPEHAPGDYTSISTQLNAQIWKPTNLPTGVRLISQCQPPVANFNANQTTIATGGTVNFTDLSTNSPTSWSWNFGDGGTSALQNPSHTYSNAGSYTVQLTATNTDGSDTEIKTAYINVIAPIAPTANFIADNTTPGIGTTVTFTDQSTGIPTSWSWNFGDGGTSSLQNPSHSYSATGTYTVSLTASNANGSDTETKTTYITVSNQSTIAVAVSTGNDDAEEFRTDGSMYLNSTDLELGNDAGTSQYMATRFQNITIPSGATITNAYVRFKADEADDISTQLNIYIAAEDVDNSPQFTSTANNISSRTLTTSQYTWASGTIPGWVIGTDYNTPNISSIIQEIINRPGWTSGNALSLVFWSDPTETDERVAFSFEGGNPAQLIIDYAIPANTPPVAAFTLNTSSVCSGGQVQFSDQSTGGATSWSWNFGDGTTSTQQNPSHTYATAGNYSVTLTVTNAGGSNSTTQNNVIMVKPNPAVVIAGNTSICSGQSTVIVASGATSYTWNNGAGNAATVTLSPSTTTTYTVTGTTNGCSDTEQITVTVNISPTVLISGGTAVCDGQSTTLIASGASSYSWSNGISNTSTATVTPNATTTYTVTGTSNGCTDTEQITVTVGSTPTVTISGATTVCSGQSITLTASGASSYSWNNGVGNSSSVTIAPTSTTTYTVTGTTNGCTDTEQITITITPSPTVSITGNTSICAGQSATLVATGATNYSWNNGAGNAATVSVSPATTTTYTVTGTSNGCTDTEQITVTVNNVPTVSISGATSTCVGQTVTLTASGASSYSWTNGIGNSSSVSVTPTTTTTYTVTGSNSGCTDSEQITITVFQLPNVTLSLPSEPICLENGTVSLTNGSPQGGTFSGTGVSGTIFNPASAGEGTHSVTYSYTDNNGCSNTATDLLTVESCANISEIGISNFKIYPNPASKFILIETTGTTEKIELTVFDANGKMIYVSTMVENPIKIDVEKWQAGTYTFQLKSTSKTTIETIVVE